MKRIGILTAGGDTPALNATIFGVVEQANSLNIEVYGIVKGFSGLLDPRVPHLHLNPLFTTIPELDPCHGGTILGASRTYIDPNKSDELALARDRLWRLGIDGLICVGGDGTISGMQPLAEFLPCVLAPKTIDNDLGLNYLDETSEWDRTESSEKGQPVYTRRMVREQFELEDMVNYCTPGYATAVYVCAQAIERIRTTAESHRRIAIIEVMGRDSGYLALGSAYGQPDIILLPEVPVDVDAFEQRVRELYDRQKHAVVVVGEGICDQSGCQLGAASRSYDPAGNIKLSGAAEQLQSELCHRLGDSFFSSRRRHDTAAAAVFTRKVGHTQRGGRPINFDRFYATQLGGKACELLLMEKNNSVATLQWSPEDGFTLGSIVANHLSDRWNKIHPRQVHQSFYDARRFQPSRLGMEYLRQIFTDAVSDGDVEVLRKNLFSFGNLTTRYQSVNIDIQRRMKYLTGGPIQGE